MMRLSSVLISRSDSTKFEGAVPSLTTSRWLSGIQLVSSTWPDRICRFWPDGRIGARVRDERLRAIGERRRRSGYPGFQGGQPGNVLLAFAPTVRLDVHADELKRKAAATPDPR